MFSVFRKILKNPLKKCVFFSLFFCRSGPAGTGENGQFKANGQHYKNDIFKLNHDCTNNIDKMCQHLYIEHVLFYHQAFEEFI